eukprot:Gb_05207 [translate_table: standard]
MMLRTNAKIIPVFYGVEAQDVRWSKGKFAGVSDHRKNFDSQMVDEWTVALHQASNIFGFSLNHYQGALKVAILIPTPIDKSARHVTENNKNSSKNVLQCLQLFATLVYTHALLWFALCMLNGAYLFPKVSDPWFLLFTSLTICAYEYDMVEFLCIGASVRSWWNEQRMWMLKRVTSYLVALMEVVVKLFGISDVGFEITNKVVLDSEAIKRYKAESFKFWVESPMFVSPSVLAVVNLICLLGGVGCILRQGYRVLDSVFVQMLLSSFVVLNTDEIRCSESGKHHEVVFMENTSIVSNGYRSGAKRQKWCRGIPRCRDMLSEVNGALRRVEPTQRLSWATQLETYSHWHGSPSCNILLLEFHGLLVECILISI